MSAKPGGHISCSQSDDDDDPSGSTTNWQFSFTAASTAWLRRTSPTTSMLCGGPRRPAVSSLGINEHTRRACEAPVNSRRPRASGGRGSRVEQSAGRCHFVAIAVDIQETAEDRTVCSELSIAPPRLTLFFYCWRCSHVLTFLSFLFCKVS